MNKIVFLTLLAIGIIYLLPLWRVSFYNSHDGEAHVARFAAYYKAYLDGQFPPRWAGDLNFGYGSPVFIFYYPLPGTIASFLHGLGISLENAFKVIMTVSFILSFLVFYLWMLLLVKRKVAFFGALLYGFAPYHFLNLYVRGDVAEMMAFVFAPLSLFFIEKYRQEQQLRNVAFGGIAYALLILSHNAVSLMFSAVLFGYCLLILKGRRILIGICAIFALGLGISAFFWMPALLEAKFTNAQLFIGDMYKDHFPTIGKLVYSPWGFGPDVNKPGGLSPQIGPVHIVVALTSIFILKKKIALKNVVFFWFLTLAISIFMSVSLSNILWENIFLLKQFEFPWRFTGLSSFAASVLGAYVMHSFFKKQVFVFLIFLIFLLSISYREIKEIPTKNDSFYYSYSGTTDYHGQASTIWTAGNASGFPKYPVEIIQGEGTIKSIIKKSNKHTFRINAESNLKVLDNTVYFPGWQVLVNGKKVPIEFQDINHRGLITFSVPSGMHIIEMVFRESPIRMFSNIVSIASCLVVFVLFLKKKSWVNI